MAWHTRARTHQSENQMFSILWICWNKTQRSVVEKCIWLKRPFVFRWLFISVRNERKGEGAAEKYSVRFVSWKRMNNVDIKWTIIILSTCLPWELVRRQRQQQEHILFHILILLAYCYWSSSSRVMFKRSYRRKIDCQRSAKWKLFICMYWAVYWQWVYYLVACASNSLYIKHSTLGYRFAFRLFPNQFCEFREQKFERKETKKRNILEN